MVKIDMHATASAATASAAASHWTARGAVLVVVRKMPQMPMKPRTAIWMRASRGRQPKAFPAGLRERWPAGGRSLHLGPLILPAAKGLSALHLVLRLITCYS